MERKETRRKTLEQRRKGRKHEKTGGWLGWGSGGLYSVRPPFQTASARLESLEKQTVEMSEGEREPDV